MAIASVLSGTLQGHIHTNDIARVNAGRTSIISSGSPPMSTVKRGKCWSHEDVLAMQQPSIGEG